MWSSLNDFVSKSEAAAKEHLGNVFADKDKSNAKDTSEASPPETKSEKTATKSSPSSPISSSAASASSPPGSAPTIVALPPKKSSDEDNNNKKNKGPNFNHEEMFNSLKSSWGSVLTATREVTKQAVETIEKEQTRIQASLFHNKNNPYKRDLHLPLDTDSLRDAEVVYITDRLITMGHPSMQSAVDGDITPHRKLAAVAHLLQKRHDGRYMVWNLSEVEYEYSILEDQVMTFEFPGCPSPPLGLLMKILLSIESWLRADDRNVAVMHCLTGRGRTSTVMAAFLCWTGEAGFKSPHRALEYMAQCKKLDVDTLTIPSQRRYVSYFSNMLDGVRPSQPPLLLKRILLSEAPKFDKYQPIPPENDNDDQEGGENSSSDASRAGQLGCAPYLQIFKAGKLVFTTAASKSYNQSKEDLPFCFTNDGSITFPIETVVQGDILVRCRHLTRKGQRVSMFRAAMHTGYIPPKVLRLTKGEIDGACNDKRYVDDFFVDLVFEECSASMASKHLLASPEQGGDESHRKYTSPTDSNPENVNNEASARRMMGTIAGSEGASTSSGLVTVTASAYDSMLHRDSRFWDVIAERRNEMNKVAANSSTGPEDEKVPSAFWGPTIGRRREFADEKVVSHSSGDGTDTNTLGAAAGVNSLHSFTIGGELDFTLDDARTKTLNEGTTSLSSSPKVPKKDDLMDALMAIDDDDDEGHDDENEVEATSETISEAPKGHDPTPTPTDTLIVEADDGLTEEIVFDDGASSESPEVAIGNTVEDTAVVENANTNVATDAKPKMEEKTTKSSDTNSMVNIDDLDINDLDNVDMDDADEDFDFNDEDDAELQDLEDFLMKAGN